LYTSGAAPLALSDIAEPKLPTPQWVRVAPRLAGICGSDLSTICAKGTPYLAPLTSMPFVMGHEVVGTITEIGRDVTDLRLGDRVVLHPALGCQARGIRPMCDACAGHRDALCRNVTRGDVPAGIQTGFCHGVGGGFGESFVAHASQVYRVPNDLDDRAAALAEKDTALVIGCGAIGLLTIAALRATGCSARIVAVAKYDHQREHARRLGANEFLDTRGSTMDRYRAWARVLDAEVFKPELGKPTVIGGATAVFDCVASSQSIDDGIRFTRSGGTFVLIGMPGMPRGVDWTPMWFKELTVHAAYAYGPERTSGGQRETFDWAIELVHAQAEKLTPLVGEPFALSDYRGAIESALNTGRSGTAKTVIKIGDGQR
jgi:threonine dehydrogenase-like Zn-dependent dehydrogenase